MSQCPESSQNLSQQATSSVSVDGTEEDLLSYWSDSAASNCDRIVSPLAYGITTTTTTTATQSARNQDCNQNTAPQDTNDQGSTTISSPGSGKTCNTNSNGSGGGGRNVRKRVMANERERERTKSLNQALEILRNRLPVPEAEKRSKIQTLRMAKEYIEFLGKFKRLSQQQQQQQQINDSSSMPNVDSSSQQQVHQYGKTLQSGSSQANAQQQYQPDSPLTYKFYKFRLKSQAKSD